MSFVPSDKCGSMIFAAQADDFLGVERLRIRCVGGAGGGPWLTLALHEGILPLSALPASSWGFQRSLLSLVLAGCRLLYFDGVAGGNEDCDW